MRVWKCVQWCRNRQGRIQDLKKEVAQWLRWLAPKTFLAKLGDFLKNLGQKGVCVRPLRPPSGSVPDGRSSAQTGENLLAKMIFFSLHSTLRWDDTTVDLDDIMCRWRGWLLVTFCRQKIWYIACSFLCHVTGESRLSLQRWAIWQEFGNIDIYIWIQAIPSYIYSYTSWNIKQEIQGFMEVLLGGGGGSPPLKPVTHSPPRKKKKIARSARTTGPPPPPITLNSSKNTKSSMKPWGSDIVAHFSELNDSETNQFYPVA